MRKMKIFLPLFFLFPLLIFATSWSGNIKIDDEVPTGTQIFYEETSLKIEWSVTNESVNEKYWISYGFSSTGPWHSCNIAENDGILENEINGKYPGGNGTYVCHWDTTSGLEPIITNEPVVYIRIKRSSDNSELITVNSFGVYNKKPTITVTSPVDGAEWSGTQNIIWSVTDKWPDDQYAIQYRYSPTGDPGIAGPFTDLATVDSTVTSYSVDTTTLPGDGYYRFRVKGTLSGSESNAPLVIVDQDAITGINITNPLGGDKCRGTVRITWSIVGGERIDETYEVEYYDFSTSSWIHIATLPKGAFSYDWDTTAIPDGDTKIRVTATSSNVSAESGVFTVDNTIPVIASIKFDPAQPNGMIPIGRSGRDLLSLTPSGWYVDRTPGIKGDIASYPEIIVRAEDPKVNGVCSGIYGIAYRVAYRIGSVINWTSWQMIPAGSMTFGPGNEWAEGTFSLNYEGHEVYVQFVPVDNAVNSISNPPNYVPAIYSADSGCWGNYGLTDESDHIKIDVTPPTIHHIEVDHLPDGPHIGGIHWYRADVNRRPLIEVVGLDNLSGVYPECCFHTVDDTPIPLISIPAGSTTYTLHPLNGEIVTFVDDCPGVRRLDGTPLPSGLWFPVYNAYGQPIHARIWDNAGNISNEKVMDPVYFIGGSSVSVKLYVDNIPPVCTVNIANNYWPTSPLDIGTYLRSYWDIWKNNLNFPRPEDASPPSTYPQAWIDYIYVVSNTNPSGLPPTTFSITVNDVPSQIVPFERYYILQKGDPDWEIQYDYFFSDYSPANPGSGVSATFSSPWYRYRAVNPSQTDDAILADLKGLWTDGTDVFYVGKRGVTAIWNGSGWTPLVNDDMHNINGISGLSSSDIYACGDGGILLHYDGNSWTPYNTKTSEDLLDVVEFTLPSGAVCVVGENGTIMDSPNPASGPGSWNIHSVQDTLGALVNLTGININGIWGDRFLPGEVWAVGDGGVVIRYNGGTTWILQDNIPTGGDLYDILGKDFNGDGNIDFIVVGNVEYSQGGTRYIGYLYYDGGAGVWRLESTGIPAITPGNFSRLPIYGVACSGNEVYMVGAKGTVIHGVYSAGSWTWNLEPVPSKVTEKLFDVAINSSGDVFVVGESGRTLYKPAGGNWTTEDLWSDWIKNATVPFTLKPGTTAIEYFAMDDLGNEEPHHKIIDPGKGVVKPVSDGKGTGNIRTDDNVPEPDIHLNPPAPDGENGWYKSPVTVTITFDDPNKWNDPLPDGTPGSGIVKFQYSLDKGATNTPMGLPPLHDYTFGTTHITLLDGKYNISAWAVDNLGNTDDVTTPETWVWYSGNPVMIDTQAPVTTLSIDALGRIVLTADDGSGSGIAGGYPKYSYDNVTWMSYTGPFYFASGESTLYFYSKDIAGNEEKVKVFNKGAVDSTPPSTTISITAGNYFISGGTVYVCSAFNPNPANITKFTLTAVDNPGGVGVAGTFYSFNKNFDQVNAETQIWNGTPFPVNQDTTTIYYYSKDLFENSEVPKHYDIVVDDTPPVTTPTVSGTIGENNWYISPVVITFNVNDTGSGYGLSPNSKTEYEIKSLPDYNPSTVYTGPVNFNSNGIWYLTYRSYDNLGNQEATKLYPNVIKIDIEVPQTTIIPPAGDGLFDLSVNETVSGIAPGYPKYKFVYPDGSESPEYSYTGKFSVPPGVAKIKYWAKDKAGNVEPENIYTLDAIDTILPNTIISIKEGPSYYDGTNLYVTSGANPNPTVFEIKSTDPVDSVTGFASGIAEGYPKYKMDSDAPDGSPSWIQYSGPFTVTSVNTSIWAYAKDGAGNEELPHKHLDFIVDDTPPTGSTLSIEDGAGNPLSPDPVTGWYNSITGAPYIVIKGTTDTGSGVREVRYTTDGTEPSLTNGISYTAPFQIDNVKIDAGNFKFAGFDNVGNKETTKSNTQNIWVDTISPHTEFSLNGNTFTLNATDNLSGVKDTYYSFDGITWNTYTGPVPITPAVTQIYYYSVDNAGNEETHHLYDFAPVEISGYVRDIKGEGVSGVKLLLIGDNGTKLATTTNNMGYYEFSNVDPRGNYSVIPKDGNFAPLRREYSSPIKDQREQNFVLYSGWTHINYDSGCTNNYRSASEKVEEGSKLIGEFTDTGRNLSILSGDIDGDGKVELLTSDGTSLKIYKYNSHTKTYDLIWTVAITGKLSLLDNVDSDTQLEIYVSTKDVNGDLTLKIYKWDNITSQLNCIKTITKSGTNTADYWIPRIGQDKVVAGIKAPEGTGLNGVSVFDYSSDTENFFVGTPDDRILSPEWLPAGDCNKDGKFELILTGKSDISDLKVKGIDENGASIFTATFVAGIKGKMIGSLADLDMDGVPEILIFESHNSSNPEDSTVYILKTDGSIDKQYRLSSTPQDNENLYPATGDINNDGVREVVVSDDNGNIYVINMLTQTLITYKPGIGRVWAINEFDGDKGNGKEIIVSSLTPPYQIKVLDKDLNEKYIYPPEGSISINSPVSCLILSDLNGDGVNEIIFSADKLYIIRPSLPSDIPAPPSNLQVSLDLNNNVVCVWQDNSDNELGFKIYRSNNPSDPESWKLVGETQTNDTFYVDTSAPSGYWTYRVTAYNECGESNPAEGEVIYVPPSGEEGGGGCFIATAAYGTPFAKEIDYLRKFRDRYLLKNRIGRALVRFYYRHSPPVAEFISKSSLLRKITRFLLTPLVFMVKLLITGHKFVLITIFALPLLPLFFLIRKRRLKNA